MHSSYYLSGLRMALRYRIPSEALYCLVGLALCLVSKPASNWFTGNFDPWSR